jgi:non-ribosomal peptide synthetase component F
MSRHDPTAPRLTIGRPTPNNTVYVLDADRRPLPIGAVGEMWAGGTCVSTGYLDNPALNAERYAPDPFLGGDHRMFRTATSAAGRGRRERQPGTRGEQCRGDDGGCPATPGQGVLDGREHASPRWQSDSRAP